MSLRETFSKRICFSVIINYSKVAIEQISEVFGTVYHVVCRRVFLKRLFRHLSNHVYHSPYLRKYIIYEGHLFSQNVQNLMYVSKMEKKMDKKVFFLRLLHLNWFHQIVPINKRTLVTASQSAKKHVLTFYIPLRETFSNSISFPLIINYNKVLWWRFHKYLETFTMYLVGGSSKTGLFRHLSNCIFCCPYFPKYISYEGYLLFQNVQTLIYISITQKNIDKKFSVLR